MPTRRARPPASVTPLAPRLLAANGGHPFDAIDLPRGEVAFRDSGTNPSDLALKILAHLAAHGCGAMEAIHACIFAAQAGSAWLEEHGDKPGLGRLAFDQCLAVAEEELGAAAKAGVPIAVKLAKGRGR